MELISTLQRNLNMNLIYSLRTSNIILDSLISIVITSFVIYIMSYVTDSKYSLKNLSSRRSTQPDTDPESKGTITIRIFGTNIRSKRRVEKTQIKIDLDSQTPGVIHIYTDITDEDFKRKSRTDNP